MQSAYKDALLSQCVLSWKPLVCRACRGQSMQLGMTHTTGRLPSALLTPPVPWHRYTNTTYNAGDGLSLTPHDFTCTSLC